MDRCYYNRYIPKTAPDTYIIRPLTRTWVTGLAEVYEEVYDEELLKNYINKKEFSSLVQRINNVLYNEYPCPGC